MDFLQDAQWVTRSQGGDKEAFGLLVETHIHWVFGLCRAIAPQDAEDLCQEVFLQAYLDLPKLREPRAFVKWLRRLAWRHCQRRGREHKVVEAREDLGLSVDPWGEVVVGLEINQAFLELTERHREVAILYLVYGYDERSIADSLGIPVGTVKSRLFHARKNLQRLLNSEGGLSMEAKDRILREVRRRIGEFEECLRPTEANLEALDRNVAWWHERRQQDAEANARAYGIQLEDTGPRMTREKVMTETLSMKGITFEHMGIPENAVLMDIRDLSRRLCVSPFTILKWVRQGMPCVNYHPMRRFDLDLATKWLVENQVEIPKEVRAGDVDNLLRYVLNQVQSGQVNVEDAIEVLEGI